ncbi:hypothetical protein B0A67_20060 [Flavobacterium aquidurense]|uniref:diacylglycerol/lipid kinase family protein n=1 Tax=Flavobacterium aquidurense TaxID=362413 RepID=UPI000917DB9B|nr:YegS/Rv2252/BmrU family lipid kinase [Flavobacterium aquidurense]OXA69054.1 hypothetical protein B0A67_20060 [Flavobacterium aquidurense]SHH86139.1 lipid kinase, YegS/Rv2252/BmrU family [Flavobacterium frigidimaris]
MASLYIHFIVNPISGGGTHNINVQMIRNFFPNQHVVVEYTQYKGHAMALTTAAMQNDPYCIVACGGDGTVNEVASCLVKSKIMLGIIPVGSGNGLASHLKIPKQINKAMEIISKGRTIRIDAGKVNHYYFFSNMGIAMDGMIIKKYEKSRRRKLMSYVWASIVAAFEYRTAETLLNINGENMWINPMLLFIANSNKMGYGMSLTPRASLTDGKLDIFIVPKINFFGKLHLAFSILKGTTESFKKATMIKCDTMNIVVPKKIFIDVQIDGEYQYLKTNKLYVTILKESLTVAV